jgi:DNA-binding NtrC family response regulator
MNEKILVIDRELDNRNMLDSILSARGYQVTCFEGPAAAFEALRSKAFDLVISEAIFPEISGPDLVRNFRQMDGEIQIIFLSGFTKIENIIQSMRGYGAFDFITKPIEDINRLITSVEEALLIRMGKKERQVYEK